MRYAILLNPDQKIVTRLLKHKTIEAISLPAILKNHLDQFPSIQNKLNRGQLLDNSDIHQLLDFQSSQFPADTQDLLFINYPSTLAQAQDLLQYAKLKNWTLNHAIYFKPSSKWKQATVDGWTHNNSEEDIQVLLKRLEKQKRSYQDILSLMPFNQAQELIADQNLMQLYHKVLRICNF